MALFYERFVTTTMNRLNQPLSTADFQIAVFVGRFIELFRLVNLAVDYIT